MATTKSSDAKEVVFEWEGKDRNGKQVRGETRVTMHDDGHPSDNEVAHVRRRERSEDLREFSSHLAPRIAHVVRGQRKERKEG